MINASLDSFQSNFNDSLIKKDSMSNFKKVQALAYFIPSILVICLIISSIFGQFVGIAIFSFVFTFGLWIVICFIKKYISLFSTLNWISLLLHITFFNISQMTQNYHPILCGSSLVIIIMIVLQIIIRKKAFFFKIYLYLYIFYGLYYCYMKQSYDLNWLTMVVLDLYTLNFLIILLRLYSRWSSYSQYFKSILICLTFPFSLMFSLCLEGSLNIFIDWRYFMVIPSISFFLEIIYLFKKRNKFKFKAQEQNQKLLYQMSQILLCDDQDYLQNPRQSITCGKSLNTCVSCYSQESKLIYASCLHACICKLCGLQWLKQSINKCPYCRMESNYLLQVQRKQWIIFKIVKIYKIP